MKIFSIKPLAVIMAVCAGVLPLADYTFAYPKPTQCLLSPQMALRERSVQRRFEPSDFVMPVIVPDERKQAEEVLKYLQEIINARFSSTGITYDLKLVLVPRYQPQILVRETPGEPERGTMTRTLELAVHRYHLRGRLDQAALLLTRAVVSHIQSKTTGTVLALLKELGRALLRQVDPFIAEVLTIVDVITGDDASTDSDVDGNKGFVLADRDGMLRDTHRFLTQTQFPRRVSLPLLRFTWSDFWTKMQKQILWLAARTNMIPDAWKVTTDFEIVDTFLLRYAWFMRWQRYLPVAVTAAAVALWGIREFFIAAELFNQLGSAVVAWLVIASAGGMVLKRVQTKIMKDEYPRLLHGYVRFDDEAARKTAQKGVGVHILDTDEQTLGRNVPNLMAPSPAGVNPAGGISRANQFQIKHGAAHQPSIARQSAAGRPIDNLVQESI